MNSWKDYPNLFANGKFKFRDPDGWKGHLDFGRSIKLLSIGVYPFDQEAFETAEVIDATKLEDSHA